MSTCGQAQEVLEQSPAGLLTNLAAMPFLLGEGLLQKTRSLRVTPGGSAQAWAQP